MIIATSEKLEVGKIYHPTIIYDAAREAIPGQPIVVVRVANEVEWMTDVMAKGYAPYRAPDESNFYEIRTD